MRGREMLARLATVPLDKGLAPRGLPQSCTCTTAVAYWGPATAGGGGGTAADGARVQGRGEIDIARVEFLELDASMGFCSRQGRGPPRPHHVQQGGVGYTIKFKLLFAKIGGIKPHASARTMSPSLRGATSRRLSVISRGGIEQPWRCNPHRATTRWSVRLRSESTCMQGSHRGTPSHCIALQS